MTSKMGWLAAAALMVGMVAPAAGQDGARLVDAAADQDWAAVGALLDEASTRTLRGRTG